MDKGKKNNNDKRRREVVVRKVVAHLCLTLIIKELNISVEHDKMVTTLNIIFSVVSYWLATSVTFEFIVITLGSLA